MASTALLIGPASALERLERQLDLLADRPVTIGWLVPDGELLGDGPVLGHVRDLEAVVAGRRPAVALVTMPAAASRLITSVRTRLRRLGVPDRFLPTLEDQLAGVGPRTHFDLDLAALIDRPPCAVDTRSIRRVAENRRVLITGAGGSIGSELARIVARHRPERLLLMERSENALFEIDRQIARTTPGLERRALLHDVVDAEGTHALCAAERPDLVIHAAAHKHVPMMELHPSAAVENNVFGTISVAEAAAACGAERCVMISTDKAVNPASIMGATKRLAELCVQSIDERADTAFSIVRFGNVLGSTGSVLDIWSREIADGGPISVTDPRMQRYFMTIQEAATLVLEAAALVDRDGPSEVFLLDMGEPVRILDMAERFIRQHGLEPVHSSGNPRTAAGGVAIVFTGVRPGEKLHEELAFSAESMQPTRHPSVNIWRVPPPPPRFLETLARRLGVPDPEMDAAALAATIRDLVPEMVRPAA